MSIEARGHNMAESNNEKGMFAFQQSPTLPGGVSKGIPQKTYVDVPPAEKKVKDHDVKSKHKFRLAIGGILAATTVGLAGFGVYQAVNTENQPQQSIYQGPLGPAGGESVLWWQELPSEQIQNLAKTPGINILENQYASTVSPELQAKAQQAGYELIRQGDPNDTTGRTVIAKNRQADSIDWTTEDLGFGRAGSQIRGIFKAWAPSPTDPAQDRQIYAILENPNTKEEYVVEVGLVPFVPFDPFDQNSKLRPTWFVVDNLDIGPDYIEEKSKIAGYRLSSDTVPGFDDPPTMISRKLTDEQTFNDLLRKQGLSLKDLVKPGDYVRMRIQVDGLDETRSTYKFKTNQDGVPQSNTFIVRRFGGTNQWKSEITQPSSQ